MAGSLPTVSRSREHSRQWRPLSEVLADWPGAVAAKPMPEASSRSATTDDSAELRRLVTAVYPDDPDDDRNEADAAALADPHDDPAIESARGLHLPDGDDRHTCRQCSNLTLGGTCAVATPGGAPSAQHAYRPGWFFQVISRTDVKGSRRGASASGVGELMFDSSPLSRRRWRNKAIEFDDTLCIIRSRTQHPTPRKSRSGKHWRRTAAKCDDHTGHDRTRGRSADFWRRSRSGRTL